MLGAIFTGLSGMTAYSKGLQIISNNVANLNSAGYKATQVSFTDMQNVGGKQGYLGSAFGSSGGGVQIGSSTIDFSQGELRQTEGDLDLAIQGSGFLVLLNDGKTYYTRTGQFSIDKDGYITEQGTGYHLAVLDADGHPVAVNIDTKRNNPPVATTKVEFSDILSSSATTATVSDITVYDNMGGKHVLTATLTRGTTDGVETEWGVVVKDSTGAEVGTGTIKFIGSAVDSTESEITVTMTPTGAEELNVVLDFTGVQSFSAGTASTIRASEIDGNGVGELTTVTVDDDGQVKLTYSNEKTELMGAVAVADFRDPQQLERFGNALFTNKGSDVQYLASGVNGVGKVMPKRIEASNVDLSKEFGDLILIQRGFQACSQVVSVSNDMIQQLFGIRGQA